MESGWRGRFDRDPKYLLGEPRVLRYLAAKPRFTPLPPQCLTALDATVENNAE